MKKISILSLTLLSFLFSQSQMRYFAGEMKGSNEKPAPNPSTARGTVMVRYNTETNTLQLIGDYQHLSDVVTAAHIHPGDSTVANGPIITLTATPSDSTGTILVTDASLTDAQEADLLAGNMYVNVHSKAYPDGEIRSQLVPATSGESQVFIVDLTPGQVEPNGISGSNAKGAALILVDKTTRMTYVTGTFEGINSNVTEAHIHRGGADDVAAAILSLNIVQRVAIPHAGTFSGSGTLSPSLVDSMINGLAYIDVHSSRYTGGAMRGQLGDVVLPIKLTYFNGHKQKNDIELIWETSEELNVSHYEIEQLNTTTESWITKGTVNTNGGSSAAKYSYTDVPNTYGNKYLMYRLKIVDKDGKISYSYLVKLNLDNLKPELFIQTNPVTNGELRYTITGLSAGKKAEVSIIDYNGRLLLKNTISSLMNNNLKISHLPAGMYKLVVRIEDKVMQQNFVK